VASRGWDFKLAEEANRINLLPTLTNLVEAPLNVYSRRMTIAAGNRFSWRWARIMLSILNEQPSAYQLPHEDQIILGYTKPD
jgi:hypothetical protein